MTVPPYVEEMPRYEPPTAVASRAVETSGPKVRHVPSSLPGPGQGFQVDPAELRAIAEKWEELANGFRNCQRFATDLVNVAPPAKDYASMNNAVMISNSGKALEKALINRENFCKAQGQKYRNLAEQYENFDRESATQIAKGGNK